MSRSKSQQFSQLGGMLGLQENSELLQEVETTMVSSSWIRRECVYRVEPVSCNFKNVNFFSKETSPSPGAFEGSTCIGKWKCCFCAFCDIFYLVLSNFSRITRHTFPVMTINCLTDLPPLSDTGSPGRADTLNTLYVYIHVKGHREGVGTEGGGGVSCWSSCSLCMFLSLYLFPCHMSNLRNATFATFWWFENKIW